MGGFFARRLPLEALDAQQKYHVKFHQRNSCPKGVSNDGWVFLMAKRPEYRAGDNLYWVKYH